METLDIFFYKLSRAIIALKEVWINYYYTATRTEQNYFLLLAFLIVLFLVIVFVLLLRFHFNRRIKKFGFVNVTHINIANEVYNKNLFIRVVLSIWNFKKLVIVEAKPFAEKMAMIVNGDLEPEVEESIVEEPHIAVKQKIKPTETSVEKTVKNTSSKVFLSKDIEDFIEERISLRTLTLEESLQDYVVSLMQNNSSVLIRTDVHKEMDTEEPIEIEETLEEVMEEPIAEMQYEEPQEIIIESTTEIDDELINKIIEEEPITEAQEESIDETPEKTTEEVVNEDDEFDKFFGKDTSKKYIVSKHSISGWQVRKVGSKRASRIFNTKSQAVTFATKSNYDFEIQ